MIKSPIDLLISDIFQDNIAFLLVVLNRLHEYISL